MPTERGSIHEMRGVAIAEALRRCRLFSSLSTEEIDSVVEGCALRNLERDESLFREGNRVEGFYVMRAGAVSVFRVTPDGREQIIWVFRPPESFAEATLATFDTYPANAVALESSQVIVVRRAPFRDLLKRNPDLSLHMLGSMSQHLKHLVQVIQDLKGRQIDTRLAEWLLQQFPAAASGSSGVIHLEQPKRVLAGELGVTSETLSRVFARLAKRGVLKVDGPRVSILDGAALRALARDAT